MSDTEYQKLASLYSQVTFGHDEPDMVWMTYDSMKAVLRGEGWTDDKIERYISKIKEAAEREEGIEPHWEFEK